MKNEWGGGLTADLTITNTGTGNAQFGFQGTWTANDTSPTAFALNGTSCT